MQPAQATTSTQLLVHSHTAPLRPPAHHRSVPVCGRRFLLLCMCSSALVLILPEAGSQWQSEYFYFTTWVLWTLYTSVLSSTQCQSIIFFYNLESLSYYYGDCTACIGYVQLNGRMCWQEISFDTGDTTCEVEQFFCKYVFNINYFTFWHECLQICDAKRSLNLSPFLLLWLYLSQISWDLLHCSVVVQTSSFTCLSKQSWRITCLITSQDQETENV